tara:strand:- start:651 stop:1052 length:402 start_codon:yes stop_codon:yes gene_type:complete
MITRQDIEDMGYEYYTDKEEDNPRTITSMVKEFADVTGQEPDPMLYQSLISEEFWEWQEEYVPTLELKELSDLVYVIFGYANAKNWDLMEAVARVHANNLGRCIQPDGSVNRRADGKIIKNQDYPKVNLNDLI